MAITFELRDEEGHTIESGGVVSADQLPVYRDPKYPYLGLIDPFGDTMFGQYQMAALIPELMGWSTKGRPARLRLSSNLVRSAGRTNTCGHR